MEIKTSRGEYYSHFFHWLSLVVIVTSLRASTSTSTSICPSHVPESSVVSTGKDEFFLDVDHPIQCNGNVTGWRICYYLAPISPDDAEDAYFGVTLGVWRITGYAWYTPVCSKYIELPLLDLQIGFNCGLIQLPSWQRFSVESGHIVGFHTHGIAPSRNVLELRSTTSTGENLARKYHCPFVYTGSPVSLSCFRNVAGAMHVHLMVEEFEEAPTTTTPTTEQINQQQPPTTTGSQSTDLDGDAHTGTVETVSSSDSNMHQQYYETTTLNKMNGDGLNDQATGMRYRTVVSIAASVGGLILITVILILIVVTVVIVVKYKRQRKLLNFKVKKDGHQHVGLDHFVIVSDMSNVPHGSIVSSPVSLEPHLYQEASTSTGGNGIVENPQIINTSGALCNPIYGADDDNVIYQTIPSDEDINERERSCEPYEIPVESVMEVQGKTSVHKESGTAANNEYAVIIKNQAVIDSTAVEEGNEQVEWNKTTQSQSTEKLVLDPQRYSALCCKILEECTTEDKFMAPATSMEDLYAQVHKQKVMELSDKDVKVLELLGSGQFGNVRRGTWKSPNGVTEVAVKTLVTNDKNISRVKLLQEATIMGQFLHPNVIKLLGIVMIKDSLMLVIELASKGDLKKLLVSMLPDPGELLAPDSSKLLLGYCQQVAFGMHYLATKGFVHRDLAARNILMTCDNILKIADFGMSRDLADENYYISQGGQIPVKWTAPEAIHYLKYSTASDVWSYGCLLYEIWSLGQVPFIHCSNSEALDKLQKGYRLPPPPGCSRAMYSVMINCWHPETQTRPSFKDILFGLHGPEDAVLKVPEKDADTHKLANCIGGPLEAGEKMYTDLQWTYFTSNDYEEQI